jgi:hypothetical protein
MWLFNRPPKEALKKAYDFEPTPEWMEHVQKSCVRFSTGGSGSIVSANGLVMTNHHVGRDIVEKLSTREKNMLETGFLAQSPAEELKAPDLELLSLWGIEDVSERVLAAGAGKSAAEADVAGAAAMAQIEEEANKSTGLHCETVTLYQGARYHLYKYKRYTDVRLVFVPESSIAAFGGDVDNFEYPRYDLDMTFFRIWEDGKPLKAEHHLAWSPNGCKEGELVLVAGHPRSHRAPEHARAPRLPARRAPPEHAAAPVALRGQAHQLLAAQPREQPGPRRRTCWGVQNSRKAYTGMLAGLLDPQLMGAKRDAEKALRAAVEKNPEWKASWGDAWGKLEAAEKVAAELYPRYVAVGSTGMTIGSNLFAQGRDHRAADRREGEAQRRAAARVPRVEPRDRADGPVFAGADLPGVRDRAAGGRALVHGRDAGRRRPARSEGARRQEPCRARGGARDRQQARGRRRAQGAGRRRQDGRRGLEGSADRPGAPDRPDRARVAQALGGRGLERRARSLCPDRGREVRARG